MIQKMESPAASGKADGAENETGSFAATEYRICESFASFDAAHLTALQAAHLASRHGFTIERAISVAPLIFGEATR